MRLRTLIGAAVLVACGSATDPEYRLRLDVDVHPTVIAVGTPVSIAVTVTNVSDRSVTVPLGGSCSRHYEVRTADEQLVPLVIACRSEGTSPVVLTPGEEWRTTYHWNTIGGDEVNQLRPGNYRIYASLFAGCPTCTQIRSTGVPVTVQ